MASVVINVLPWYPLRGEGYRRSLSMICATISESQRPLLLLSLGAPPAAGTSNLRAGELHPLISYEDHAATRTADGRIRSGQLTCLSSVPNFKKPSYSVIDAGHFPTKFPTFN